MSEIRFESVLDPTVKPALAHKLAGLFTRSSAMGLLSGPAYTRLDAAAVTRLVKSLHRHGIGGDAAVGVAPLMQSQPASHSPAAERALEQQVDRLLEALEASAAPEAEWPAMRAVFGDEALGDLLELSHSSLKRYAAGQRATPPDTVQRLHWLALLVADLTGAYNHHGIQRWFSRPRAQLGGRSPREHLGSGWSIDGRPAAQVRALAAALSGARALAV